MNTKLRGPAELFASRSTRMLLLLQCKAPACVIATEARLICEGFHGGKWRNVGQALLEATCASWNWRVTVPLVRALCRLNIYHSDMGLKDSGCVVCGKGAVEGGDLEG